MQEAQFDNCNDLKANVMPQHNNITEQCSSNSFEQAYLTGQQVVTTAQSHLPSNLNDPQIADLYSEDYNFNMIEAADSSLMLSSLSDDFAEFHNDPRTGYFDANAGELVGDMGLGSSSLNLTPGFGGLDSDSSTSYGNWIVQSINAFL